MSNVEQLQTKDEPIILQVVKFSQTDAYLNDLSNEVHNLTIAGESDKKGYQLIKSKRISLRDERIELEAYADTLRSTARAYITTVNADEIRIVNFYKSLEAGLKEKEVDFDNLKKKREEEEKKTAALRLQSRINLLICTGLTLMDSIYRYGEFSIDVLEVDIMKDEPFFAFVDEVRDAKEFNDNLARVEREAFEENQRIEQEKAEAARLAEIETNRLAKAKNDADAAILLQIQQDNDAEALRIKTANEALEKKMKDFQEKQDAAAIANKVTETTSYLNRVNDNRDKAFAELTKTPEPSNAANEYGKQMEASAIEMFVEPAFTPLPFPLCLDEIEPTTVIEVIEPGVNLTREQIERMLEEDNDRDKLIQLSANISKLYLPFVTEASAVKTVGGVRVMLEKMIAYLDKAIDKMK